MFLNDCLLFLWRTSPPRVVVLVHQVVCLVLEFVATIGVLLRRRWACLLLAVWVLILTGKGFCPYGLLIEGILFLFAASKNLQLLIGKGIIKSRVLQANYL